MPTLRAALRGRLVAGRASSHLDRPISRLACKRKGHDVLVMCWISGVQAGPHVEVGDGVVLDHFPRLIHKSLGAGKRGIVYNLVLPRSSVSDPPYQHDGVNHCGWNMTPENDAVCWVNPPLDLQTSGRNAYDGCGLSFVQSLRDPLPAVASVVCRAEQGCVHVPSSLAILRQLTSWLKALLQDHLCRELVRVMEEAGDID